MTEDYTTADPRTLTAPDLVKWLRARAIFKDHWTAIATAIGRVADERIYERTEYGAAVSEEEWAKEKLGMTRGEVRLALKLWRAMGRHPEVPWTRLPKPRALLLDEVLTAGGSWLDWSARALNAASTKALETEMRRYLSEDVFHTLTIRYPESMTELVEEAFSRAAQTALSPEQGNDPPPDGIVAPEGTEGAARPSWRTPAVAFRALEVLCVEYIAMTKPGGEMGGCA